jgi:hypothetical protein
MTVTPLLHILGWALAVVFILVMAVIAYQYR